MSVEFPNTRIKVDTEDLISFNESEWTWSDLNTLLSTLQANVDVLPENADDIANIAIEWDADMGYRYMSPYLMRWVKGDLTIAMIASYLKTKFASKWNKMWDAMTSEYNPLHNYDMSEEEHTDEIRDEESSNTDATNNTNTVNNTVNNKVYAYNSSTASDDSETTDATNETNVGQRAGSGTFDANNDIDRTLTRSGNIGVTTSQQLIEAELELRQHIVLDVVRDDIMSILSIPYIGGKY